MDSIYAGDPRVEFVDDACVVIPDTDGAGQPDNWFVLHSEIDGLWHVSSQSLRGHPNTEPDGMQTCDDAIREVLGEPLWEVEAELITDAGDDGQIQADALDDDPVGVFAMHGLAATGVFNADPPTGDPLRYLLTAAGLDLYLTIHDLVDGAGDERQLQQLLDERRTYHVVS